MQIEPKQYLSLLDEIEQLKQENLLLKEENAALAHKLVLQQQKHLEHEHNAIKAMQVVEELHAKAIAYEIEQKEQILKRVAEIQKQTKTYLQTKFSQLQNSSLTQFKSLQLQSAKTKLDYYELVEFVNKIRAMYNSTMGLDVGRIKKEATLMELTKWLKSLPGVAVSLMKTGFSTSTNWTGMKKKTLNQSKFKENRIPSSAERQKSRVKI